MTPAGKTLLITGSSNVLSLGWTAAKLLALGPYGFSRVILSGRNQETLDAAVQSLQSALDTHDLSNPHRCTVRSVVLDVTSSDSIKELVKILSNSDPTSDSPLGEYSGRLDVLINNAGIGAPPGRVEGTTEANMFLKTEDTTADDVISVMRTNVGAVVELSNALLPSLALSPAPRIVNVSSARGSLSFEEGLAPERTGALVYNASKAALNMVTVMQSKNLPVLAPGLKVNAATPGHTKTPFNNFTGYRTLEEGAGVVVHLATLPPDGPTGQLMGDHAPYSKENGKFVRIPW